MADLEAVRSRFQAALDALVAKAEKDPYILALVLIGSLSHDVVWERSDIDLYVVTQEMKVQKPMLTLTEEDVTIHAHLCTRSAFRRVLEGSLGSGFMHSTLSKGTLIYCADETLEELFAERRRFGERDREVRLLTSAAGALYMTTKAQKWYITRKDVEYTFFWIMKSVDSLAAIELAWRHEIAGREVIQPALRLNPEFFRAIYTDLIHGPKTRETVGAALERIETYLLERAPVMFRPIYDYLREAGGPRSNGEIDDYFQKNMNAAVTDICEWMADHRLIDRVSRPVRLTEKSRVSFEEAAYYYDGDA